MNSLKRISVFVVTLLQSVSLWAQDKKVDVDIDVNKGVDSSFHMQPWMWIAGGAVFILILAGILMSSRRKA